MGPYIQSVCSREAAIRQQTPQVSGASRAKLAQDLDCLSGRFSFGPMPASSAIGDWDAFDSVGIAETELAHEREIIRGLGGKWRRDRTSVLLKVPSAIVPPKRRITFSYPLHPDASHFSIVQTYRYPVR